MWGTFWTAVGALGAIIVPLVIHHLQSAKKRKTPDYTVEGEKWVLDRGWSYEDLLHRLIDLDYLTLAGVQLSPEDEGTVDQWAPVFQKSPETWALIVYRKKKIVGYWSYFSVSPKLAQEIAAGTMKDSEITASETKSIYEPGGHTIYFAMIARDPDMPAVGDNASRLLLKSLIDSMLFFWERVEIERVYAVCFTRDSEKLCRNFNLRFVSNTVSGKPLYVGTRENFEPRRLKRLT